MSLKVSMRWRKTGDGGLAFFGRFQHEVDLRCGGGYVLTVMVNEDSQEPSSKGKCTALNQEIYTRKLSTAKKIAELLEKDYEK